MKLYFSGIASVQERQVLEAAGVSQVLVDPEDFWVVEDWAGQRILDSGAYRALKTTGLPPDVMLLHQLDRAYRFDYVVGPDVIGDPHATKVNWIRFWPSANNTVIPTWHWGEPGGFLQDYLLYAPVVGIGGLVPLMRAKDEKMLAELVPLCRAHPGRFHIFGLNWLKAIQQLKPYAFSADTSKFIDGARYGHIIFVHTKTGNLQQIPARAAGWDERYAAMNRFERMVECARVLKEFCCEN